MRSRPARFVLVGIWNTVFGYLAFVGCVAVTRWTGVSYLYATVPAQILGILNAYLCHRVFTYADGDRSLWSFVRFNGVYWVLFVANVVLLWALVDGLGWKPEVAQGLLTGVVAMVSYAAHKRYSFKVS